MKSRTFSSSSRAIDYTESRPLNSFGDAETPTRWKKLTVCCPQAHRSQTNQNQRADDVDSWWPHHRPIRRMSTSWPRPPQPSPQQVAPSSFPWTISRSHLGSWGVGSLAWVPLLPRMVDFLNKAIFLLSNTCLSVLDSWATSTHTWVLQEFAWGPSAICQRCYKRHVLLEGASWDFCFNCKILRFL